MSTYLRDLPSAAVLGGTTPRTVTAHHNGAAADLLAGDGRCFAVQQVGTVSGGSPTLAGKVQESADGSSWSDVAGASFATVTATNDVQAIAFDRSLRYVRYVGTVGGSSPSFAIAVLIGQQKKQA